LAQPVFLYFPMLFANAPIFSPEAEQPLAEENGIRK